MHKVTVKPRNIFLVIFSRKLTDIRSRKNDKKCLKEYLWSFGADNWTWNGTSSFGSKTWT
jgi:hypothetical protein